MTQQNPPYNATTHPHDRIASALERIATAFEAYVGKMPRPPRPKREPIQPADDATLDGEYGDPRINYGLKERYWAQPDTFVGRSYSQCPIAYLKKVAEYKESCVEFYEEQNTPESLKKARYARGDAARAYGWARRIAAGWMSPQQSATVTAFGGDDDIPF